MQWSADRAARELWSGLDKNATNGDALAYFREELQRAYDAGKAAALAGLMQDNIDHSDRIKAEIAERRTEIRRGARTAPARFKL